MATSTRFQPLFKGILFLLLTTVTLVLLTSSALATSQAHGTVTDATTGEPIEGATIYVYDPNDKGGNFYQTKSDASGGYTLECPPGDYHVYVSKDGYTAHDEAVTLDGSVEHDVALTPGSGTGKDDYNKDDTNKTDYTKDDYNKNGYSKDDYNKDVSDEKSDLTNTLLFAILGVVIVIVVFVAVVWVKLRGGGKGTMKEATGKKEDWTTCPKCGTDLKMKNLPSHLDNVHQGLSAAERDTMIEGRNTR